jgi:hypothetical protein
LSGQTAIPQTRDRPAERPAEISGALSTDS